MKRARHGEDADDADDEVLQINVGGKFFVTKRSTLCGFDDSMLAKMFKPDSPFSSLTKDTSGRIFIDRDPEAFEFILLYLMRGAVLTSFPQNDDLLARVVHESDYFGLQELTESLTAIKSVTEQKLVVMNTETLDEEEQDFESEMASYIDDGWKCKTMEVATRQAEKFIPHRETLYALLERPTPI